MNRCAVIDITECDDNIIMLEFLILQKLIDYIVFDPSPDLSISDVKQRYDKIKTFKMPIREMVLPRTRIVFNGGALTKVADHLERGGNFEWLFCAPSPTLNIDAFSSQYVLDHHEYAIRSIILISDNLCHTAYSSRQHLFSGTTYDFIDKYGIDESQPLPALLMATEAQRFIGGKDVRLMYKRARVHVQEGPLGKKPQWGATLDEESNVQIAIQIK